MSAQSNWEQTNGPEGGNVVEIAPSPDDNIYVGTLGGIYRSTDNGDNWQRLELPSNLSSWNEYISSIAVNEDGDIFTIVGGSILRSLDQGNTWEVIYENEDGPILGPLAINTEGTIITFEFIYNPNLSTHSNLIRSTDNGDSWETAGSLSQFNDIVQQLVSNSNDQLFALVLWGMYRSTDNGDSWTFMHDSLRIHSIAINSSDEIFIGTDSAIYRSVNNGDSFTRVFTGVNAWRLAIGNDDEVYATVDNAIYMSTDNGESWNIISNGLSKSTFVYTELAVDSLNNVFAGGDGLHMTSNNGTTWNRIVDGLWATDVKTIESKEDRELFVLTTTNEIFRSTNNGDTWVQVQKVISDTAISFLKMTGTDEVFYSHAGNLFRSTNNGETWSTLYSVDTIDIRDIAKSMDNDLFLATNTGIIVSTDDGETWTRLETGIACNYLSTITINNTGTIFTGSESCDSIYISENNGDTWDPIPIEFDLLNIVINSEDHLLASYTEGIDMYRSVDNGRTWTRISAPAIYNSNIVIDASDNVYIPGNNGVYYSTDFGETWIEISEGFKIQNISSVGVGPGGIYSSPYGMGVWRRELFVDVENIDLSKELNIYPNPASHKLTVVYPGNLTNERTLSIHDIQGKLVKRLPVSGSSTTIDVSALLKGIYMISVSGSNKVQKIVIH